MKWSKYNFSIIINMSYNVRPVSLAKRVAFISRDHCLYLRFSDGTAHRNISLFRIRWSLLFKTTHPYERPALSARITTVPVLVISFNLPLKIWFILLCSALSIYIYIYIYIYILYILYYIYIYIYIYILYIYINLPICPLAIMKVRQNLCYGENWDIYIYIYTPS